MTSDSLIGLTIKEYVLQSGFTHPNHPDMADPDIVELVQIWESNRQHIAAMGVRGADACDAETATVAPASDMCPNCLVDLPVKRSCCPKYSSEISVNAGVRSPSDKDSRFGHGEELRGSNPAPVPTSESRYLGYDSLSEESKAAYHKGYDRGLADATREPVSLIDCAMSLQCNDRIKLGSDLQAIAKTVLDAAGVKYHE